MTLEELLDFVNYVANKEKSGNTLAPEQFNRILQAVNADFFKKEYEEAQRLALKLNKKLSDVIFNSASLRKFRYREDSVSVTDGAITISGLSETYVYWISMITEYNSALRGVEFISDLELEDRQTNLLGKPIKYYPVAIDNGDNINIFPKDISSVDFTYLRMPATPVYAWTVDANDNINYDVGNATELEWASAYHPQVAQEILARIGVSLGDQQLEAYIERTKQSERVV